MIKGKKAQDDEVGGLGFMMKLIIVLLFLAVVLGIIYMLWKSGASNVGMFWKSCSRNIGG